MGIVVIILIVLLVITICIAKSAQTDNKAKNKSSDFPFIYHDITRGNSNNNDADYYSDSCSYDSGSDCGGGCD